MFSVLLAGSSAYSQTAAQPDLDRDGIPNISDRDVDNDGIPNGRDRNIDGGTARSSPLRGRYIGDKLPNSHGAELDIDADGLPDNHFSETDIDGDGLLDSDQRRELDTDGDGVANGLDADLDGDGLANNSDPDMHGTEDINDWFQTVGDGAYAPDAIVASTIAYVSAEVRRILQIPATDNGLRVRVSAYGFGTWVIGEWRYLSADNIQIRASWVYPSSDSSQLKVFVNWIYTGPYLGTAEDYSNPANYVISEENRLVAEFPGGGHTLVGWEASYPAGFYYTLPNQHEPVFAPPYEPLRTALSSYRNFEANPHYLYFSGSLVSTPGFPGVQPIINLQRTIMRVSRAWYGQLEAQQLR